MEESGVPLKDDSPQATFTRKEASPRKTKIVPIDDDELEDEEGPAKKATSKAVKKIRRRKKRKELTEEQTEVIRKAFNMYDTDGSGSIEERELQQVMKALGFPAKTAEVKEMLKELDEDKSGTVEFSEFLNKMKEKILAEHNIEEEVRRAFKFYDFDETGVIDIHKLKKVSVEIDEKASNEDLAHMIRVADTDHDGFVTIDDFINVMVRMMII